MKHQRSGAKETIMLIIFHGGALRWQQGSKIKGDDKSMSRYNLYDVYKGKEKILSEVTAGQIEEKIGVKSTIICRYCLEGHTTKDGYRFVNTQITVDKKTQKTSDDWRKEWDEIRFKLNPNAKK